MINLSAIKTIALYEAKLLWRSWSFRIFSIIGLTVFISTTIGIGAKFSFSPYYLSALSSSLPLANVKMLNLYQGIIAVFMATEFFKRDRKHDSNQVIFTRSYSNTDYLLGKFIGILFVFAVLNILVLAATLILHVSLSNSPLAVMPYLIYPIVIGFPTLVFMIGVSVFLITLIRNQAVVFIIMLAYSLLVMIYIGRFLFTVFDVYALYQPILYSDIYGFINLPDVLLLRGAYLLAGLGFLFITVIFSRRLSQSGAASTIMVATGACCIAIAGIAATGYVKEQFDIRDQRTEWRSLSQTVPQLHPVKIITHDISVDWHGQTLSSKSTITAVNENAQPKDSILLTLNPGLEIASIVSDNGREIPYSRNEFLLWLKPTQPLVPNEMMTLTISYQGHINDNYCFLDIENSRFEDVLTAWLYRIPKRYAVVRPEFLHLTPECGWYPIAGLSNGTAFPRPNINHFTQFSLTVNGVPKNFETFSQGSRETTADNTVTFTPDTPLKGISLTSGPYQCDSITVDSIDYTVAHFPGHDYYREYMNQLSDTIPNLIRELRNGYEVQLGLDYPFKRLTLVESPAEVYAYKRFWTTAMDIVQPELLFITELGVFGSGTDFKLMKRSSTRMQEHSNQATGEVETQTWYFTNFVKMDVLGTLNNRWDPRSEEDIELRTSIACSFTDFVTQINSDDWAIINFALQSAIQKRIDPIQEQPFWMAGGLDDKERANLALHDAPLQSLIADTSLDIDTRQTALNSKSNYLFLFLDAKRESGDFNEQLNTYLNRHRFTSISEDEFSAFIDGLGDIDFKSLAAEWGKKTDMPGYVVDAVEAYKVLDGDRTKSQMRLSISNPTSIDGLVTVNIRYQQQRGAGRVPWFMRGQEKYDFTRLLYMPAKTSRHMGLLLDQQPAEMTIETLISLNIPGDLAFDFRRVELELEEKRRPFEGDSVFAYQDEQPPDSGEYLVDNEDAGFSIINTFEENYLRRKFTEWFDLNRMEDKYVSIRWWDPPSIWMPTSNKDFYGKFVRSAYFKETKDGDGKVAWEVDLEETGNYDVYYHYEGEDVVMPMFRRRGPGSGPPQKPDRGELHFVIYHEDGVENVTLDLNTAEAGWNYLGTYRLVDGVNRVELTDKNETDIIIADAVKWVKR
ncbi:MAG: hypothetical protein R3F48_04760 [Candidatus Zixiibacteriota bacterium]